MSVRVLGHVSVTVLFMNANSFNIQRFYFVPAEVLGQQSSTLFQEDVLAVQLFDLIMILQLGVKFGETFETFPEDFELKPLRFPSLHVLRILNSKMGKGTFSYY